jgi:hypothetical protein
MPRVSKVTQHARATKLLAGIAKRFPAKGRRLVGGTSYTRRELAALFQDQLDAMAESSAAHAALKAAVRRERAATERARAVEQDLRLWAESLYGRASIAITDFGWRIAKKPGPKTAKAKRDVVEKGAATRAARETLGKRQRQKLRGAVLPRAASKG